MQDAGHVDAARDDFAVFFDGTGDGFAREGGRVELAYSLDNDSIDGHTLARFDYDDVIHRHLRGIDIDEFAVALDVRVVWRDVHERRDGFTALAHGVTLKQFSYLVEQHDGRTFGHMRVGAGEQDHGKGAECRHRHEKALVEGVASADVAPRFAQHVMTCDEVGDEVEREARIDGARATESRYKEAGLIDKENGEKDRQSHEDALEQLFLFLVHRCHLF